MLSLDCVCAVEAIKTVMVLLVSRSQQMYILIFVYYISILYSPHFEEEEGGEKGTVIIMQLVFPFPGFSILMMMTTRNYPNEKADHDHSSERLEYKRTL